MDKNSNFVNSRIGAHLISGLLFFCLVFYATYVFAHASGMTGVTKKNGNGCTCHGASPTTSVVVTIEGPAELAPNQTANYTVTVQGGPAVRAGTDIAASAGTLNPSSSALQKIGEELTHSSPQPFANGVATFSFTYTAPATPGTYTIFANGNSVNFNGFNSGDQWNFAPNKLVTVNAATVTAVENSSSVPSAFSLSQNYPNPFNPSTTISYEIGANSYVTLKVLDVLGREVATLVSEQKGAGSYKTTWNAANASSGSYFYQLRAGQTAETRRMVLAK
jgi:hypothetical protein